MKCPCQDTPLPALQLAQSSPLASVQGWKPSRGPAPLWPPCSPGRFSSFGSAHEERLLHLCDQPGCCHATTRPGLRTPHFPAALTCFLLLVRRTNLPVTVKVGVHPIPLQNAVGSVLSWGIGRGSEEGGKPWQEWKRRGRTRFVWGMYTNFVLGEAGCVVFKNIQMC